MCCGGCNLNNFCDVTSVGLYQNNFKLTSDWLIKPVCFKAKKTEKQYEGFDNLHIILLIHVYASTKIRQIK